MLKYADLFICSDPILIVSSCLFDFCLNWLELNNGCDWPLDCNVSCDWSKPNMTVWSWAAIGH